MNNLLTLTKIYIKQIFGRYLYGEKAKKRGLYKTVLLILALTALIEYSIASMIYMFAKQLEELNLQQFVLIYGLIISALFSIFIVSYEIPSHFYKAKDYENLASLPIQSWVVVSAKFLSGFLTALIYSLLFSLPTYVIYFMFNSVTVGGIIYALISLIFVPMFVMFISCIIGFIINYFSSKFKSKSIVNTILMFVFLGAIMAFSFSSSAGVLTNLFSSGECPLTIKIITPYIYFIFNAIYLNSFVYFLFFILINLAYFSLSILIVSLTYKKINSNMLISKSKVSNKPLNYEPKSQLKTLFNKEAKGFFGSSMWTLNGLVGPIMTIVFAIMFGVLLLESVEQLKMASSDDFTISITTSMFKIMYLGFTSVMVGTSVSTCTTISMEGKKFAILKQLPLSFKQIATAKILFSCAITLPFVFIGNIIFACFIPFDALFLLISFILPIISVLTFSVLGLVINLKYPKLNWNNEAEAVKQSLSLFVSMFSDMGIGAIPLVIYFALYETLFATLPLILTSLIFIVWFLIWLIVSLILLKNKGEKLYNKIIV